MNLNRQILGLIPNLPLVAPVLSLLRPSRHKYIPNFYPDLGSKGFARQD